MHLSLALLMVATVANAYPAAPVQKVWPPGISPAACPDFPNCPPGVNPYTGIKYADIPVQKVYPANSPAAACVNYPYCNETPSDRFVLTGVVQVPAGVPAALCVNYPYC